MTNIYWELSLFKKLTRLIYQVAICTHKEVLIPMFNFAIKGDLNPSTGLGTKQFSGL